MTVIGLTGNIGSGKTTVCRMLAEEKNCACLNADYLGRLVAEPEGEAYDELRREFGDEYFLADGTLDRPHMADLVFNNSEALQRLNGIMHPAILRRICREIEQIQQNEPERVIVVEAALLIEANYLGILDQLWLVWACDSVRRRRVMARDGVDAAQAQARMDNQMPQQEKAKYAQYILHNNRGKKELRAELERVWQQFAAERRLSLAGAIFDGE